jgi:hypothetical protein
LRNMFDDLEGRRCESLSECFQIGQDLVAFVQ